VTKQLLDHSLTTSELVPPPRLPLMALMAIAAAFLLVFLAVTTLQKADPYTQQVLDLPGNAAQGRVIFQQNCAVCHGLDANGKVGPSLSHVSTRKSRAALIEQVISGNTPPMPQFQPTPEVMADLLEYLESL
jgi:mono/diheme cytochrome c family protein